MGVEFHSEDRCGENPLGKSNSTVRKCGRA